MLVFRNNIGGFVYNTQQGIISKIFKAPLSEELIGLLENKTYGEHDVLFANIEAVREMFQVTSKEELSTIYENLDKALDFN